MIYLYLKEHKITGMKYLGMTSAADPYKYQGSGKYWRNHLAKHGTLIETIILFKSEDKTKIKEKGKFYSELYNVVESKEFANLKIEEGDGGWDFINSNNSNYQELYRQNGKKVGASNKGTTSVKDKNGKIFRVTKDDPRIENGELVGATKGKLAAYDKNDTLHYIDKDDIRLKTGELRSNNAGKIYITNGVERKLVRPDSKLPIGWYVGDNREKYNLGKIWITDGINSRMIFKSESIPKGWKKGRKIRKSCDQNHALGET